MRLPYGRYYLSLHSRLRSRSEPLDRAVQPSCNGQFFVVRYNLMSHCSESSASYTLGKETSVSSFSAATCPVLHPVIQIIASFRI